MGGNVRLKSTNWMLPAGTIPFLAGIMILGCFLLTGSLQRLLLAGVVFACCAFVIRKVWFLPRPEASYGEMEAHDFSLPGEFQARTFLCPSMDQYDFIRRNVEVLSPLIPKKDEEFRIAVSPRYLDEQGERITRIAVMNAIIRYRNATQMRLVLGLVTPLLVLVNLILLYFVAGRRYVNVPDALVRLVLPFVLMLLVAGLFLWWNGFSQRLDYRTDRLLSEYFSADEVAEFLRAETVTDTAGDTVSEKKQNTKKMEDYLTTQRIKRLYEDAGCHGNMPQHSREGGML